MRKQYAKECAETAISTSWPGQNGPRVNVGTDVNSSSYGQHDRRDYGALDPTCVL